MRIITICIGLLVCAFAHSQAVKDTVFFTNGTVVVGKLESVKLGVVTFDPDDANNITVQLRKLRTMAAGRKIFRIETVRDEVYFGTILAHPATHSIYVANGPDTITMHLEDISVLYAFDKSIAQRFTGTVGIGYTYTRSSGFGRFNFDSKIKYSSRKAELNLTTNGIYTIYDSLLSREKEEVSLKYNYYFLRNWFATAFVSYQRNLELGLQRRFQEGVGIGNKFYTSKHVYTWARGGFVINQERSTEDVESGILSELFGQVEINLFRFEHPKVNFLLAETFYYSLSESGRFRNDGSMSVTWEVFKNFNLSLEPYNNYDSKPPGADSRQFDFGIVFGINYKLNY
jgi:hypothetical protein